MYLPLAFSLDLEEARYVCPMEFEQPANKRQRLDHYEGACDNNEPVDAFVSPAASWGFDGFAQDPSYLASQAELRSLMFDTARSLPPHRPLTPSEKRQDEQPNLVKVLAHGNRVKYLSNYLSRVAPWVRSVLHGFAFDLLGG